MKRIRFIILFLNVFWTNGNQAQVAPVDTLSLHWEHLSDLATNMPLQSFNGYIWQRGDDYTWSRSADEGKTWEALIFPAHFERITNNYGGKGLWIIKVVGQGSGYYYSADQGQNWRPIAADIDAHTFIFQDDRIYFYGKELAWSDDRGMTWEKMELPANTNQLFVEKEGMIAQFYGHFHRSFDAGQTWENLANLPTPSNVLSVEQNQLWLTSRTGQMWTSDNWGEDWGLTSDSLPDSGWGWASYRDRFDCPFIGEGLIVMEDHYFLTSNNFPHGIAHIILGQNAGACWGIAANIPSTKLKSYFFHGDYFYIHDAWNLWRVERRALNEQLCGEPTNTTDLQAEQLAVQVFPNPMSTDAQLTFHLQEESTLQLMIYNANGNAVWETPRQKYFSKGPQQWIFSLDLFSPGVYTLTLKNARSNEGNNYKALLLIKWP